MANVDNANGFSFERRVGGGPSVPLERAPTISNGTIAAGDALLISAGLVRTALAASTKIHGVAAEGVTGVTGTRNSVAFYPALPDMIFSGQTDGDASESDLGARKGILGTTGIMEVDSTGATTSVLQVVGLKKGSTWDSHARVLFIWVRSSFGGSIGPG